MSCFNNDFNDAMPVMSRPLFRGRKTRDLVEVEPVPPQLTITIPERIDLENERTLRRRRHLIIQAGRLFPGASVELCAQSVDEGIDLYLNPLTSEWELGIVEEEPPPQNEFIFDGEFLITDLSSGITYKRGML